VPPAPTFQSSDFRFILSTRIFPALVLVVCVLVTAFAVSRMRAAEEDEAFANFSQSSRRLARDAELRLAGLTQLASTGAGLLNLGQSLDREGWAAYIAGLQTTGHGSGFQGLGVAHHVPSAEAVVLPVTYLVPTSDINERLTGFDLGSDPVFASAIMLARDRGEPSISGIAETGADTGASAHTLFLFAPFYRGGRPDSINARREAFAGVVLIALNAERLLQPLVEQEGTRGIGLRANDLEQDRVVFNSRPGLDYSGTKNVVQYKVTLGGRNWQLDFAATPEWRASIPHRNSLLVGLVGALGGLLLTGIVYHLAALRQSAEKLALDATAELRASEVELLRHRDNLTELVAERTADLSAAKNAAEQAYRAKSEFLANMSHEFRTPLHAILSFARLGQERTSTQTDEKTQRYFSRIVDAGERLLSLVSNLLDLSKIEAGKMRVVPQPGDLVKMLHDVAAEFEALAEERKLQWSMPAAEVLAPARVDAARFSQVLRNVFSNAMKFSPDGGMIRILVEEASMPMGRRADDQAALVAAWRIAVIDEGVGIPEDELETVFDSFVQSSKTRDGAGGTGLGLTICREIVAAHRGSISARNRPGGGAIFEIMVPR